LKHAKALLRVVDVRVIHTGLVVVDRVTAPDDAPLCLLHGNPEIGADGRSHGTSIQVAHPPRIDASGDVACEEGATARYGGVFEHGLCAIEQTPLREIRNMRDYGRKAP
jgi:hypothetical protein